MYLVTIHPLNIVHLPTHNESQPNTPNINTPSKMWQLSFQFNSNRHWGRWAICILPTNTRPLNKRWFSCLIPLKSKCETIVFLFEVSCYATRYLQPETIVFCSVSDKAQDIKSDISFFFQPPSPQFLQRDMIRRVPQFSKIYLDFYRGKEQKGRQPGH